MDQRVRTKNVERGKTLSSCLKQKTLNDYYVNIIRFNEKSLSTMKKIWIGIWIMCVSVGMSQAKLSLGALATSDLTIAENVPAGKVFTTSSNVFQHDHL